MRTTRKTLQFFRACSGSNFFPQNGKDNNSYFDIILMLTSKLNHSQKIITKCDGIIANCDSLVYYKVRWTVITNCDSFFITKCDTVYYKLRQVLRSAMDSLQIAIGVAKWDDYYKLRQYSISFEFQTPNRSH